MGPIEVVVGTFPTRSDASAAAADLASDVRLDGDLVVTERVRFRGEDRGRRREVLVAWVPAERSGRARDLIRRHHGRQAPFDWLNGRQELVASWTFPEDAQDEGDRPVAGRPSGPDG